MESLAQSPCADTLEALNIMSLGKGRVSARYCCFVASCHPHRKCAHTHTHTRKHKHTHTPPRATEWRSRCTWYKTVPALTSLRELAFMVEGEAPEALAAHLGRRCKLEVLCVQGRTGGWLATDAWQFVAGFEDLVALQMSVSDLARHGLEPWPRGLRALDCSELLLDGSLADGLFASCPALTHVQAVLGDGAPEAVLRAAEAGDARPCLVVYDDGEGAPGFSRDEAGLAHHSRVSWCPFEVGVWIRPRNGPRGAVVYHPL